MTDQDFRPRLGQDVKRVVNQVSEADESLSQTVARLIGEHPEVSSALREMNREERQRAKAREESRKRAEVKREIRALDDEELTRLIKRPNATDYARVEGNVTVLVPSMVEAEGIGTRDVVELAEAEKEFRERRAQAPREPEGETWRDTVEKILR